MNWKTFLASWREVLVGIVAFLLVALLLSTLGSEVVANNPVLSVVVSGITRLAMGALTFIAVCAAAWFGLSVTFPEANKAIVSDSFDDWWKNKSTDFQTKVSLIAVAVLLLAAAICFAS